MPPKDADIPQHLSTKPNPRNNPTIFKIFQNVQYNVVQHKKYVKEMTKLFKKLDQDTFRESFKNALHYLFTFGDTSSNVDRVVQFVATFCTTLDDEEEFLLFIFDIIFDCQCVSGQSVRYRASQLLAAVLSALGEDASLDDDLCDKLLASQMQRLQDTRGAVRCRAALALQRLQNPMEPDDDVTRAYRFHMSCDPSSSVRRAVVMSIAKYSRNIPYVLERLCDVDQAVRRAAFLYIAGINVTQLKVRQRVLTLKVGLTERNQRVRRVVEEILIPGWLANFQGNIVHLLKAIRLDNAQDAKDSQYVAGKLLESLFKRLPILELLEWLPTDKKLRLIPTEKLNKETAWYWRHLAEHLQKIDDDETLEIVLPDLVVLTEYIRAIVELPCPSESSEPAAFSTRQYVLCELASLLRVYDATDPAGRNALQTLVTDVLTGDYGPLNSDVIHAFVSALELVMPEIPQRMEVISGIINSLRDPPEVEAPPQPLPTVDSAEVKMQRARLRVSLNVAIEAQEEAVREQNYALAAECKAKVEDIQKKLEELVVQAPPPPPPIIPSQSSKEKISDADTLNKCLIILNSALDTPQLKTVTPMLRMIFNELEVELFQNPDLLENALQTVALYGMLDKEFAKENKSFFFANLIDTTNEPIVSVVLRCIVDLLCVHGARVFEDETTEQQANESKSSKSKRNLYNSLGSLGEDYGNEQDTWNRIQRDDLRSANLHKVHHGDNRLSEPIGIKTSAFALGNVSPVQSLLRVLGSISESAISLSPVHSTVIELLLKMMDSTCASYRLIIVEGLCRLLHLGHLESPSILSRLLLLWFNPATVEEDMLRQTIGVFFQTFPVCVDGAQEQIQKATLPTLRTLANAPSSSPLAEIDQEAVVRFIVSLTRVNHELIDSQGAMALLLCNYIVRRPTSSEVGLVCRMLALLSPPRDGHLATELAAMLRDLCLKLPDKQSCRNLTRYLGSLEALERASLASKISNTGVTEEGTTEIEDTLAQIGRATSSMTQPLARSTHVVINETVEEEPEIDETSPTEVPRISSEQTSAAADKSSSSKSNHGSSETDPGREPDADAPSDGTDSSGASPIKKAKITKGKKKKLSLSRKNSDKEAKAAKEKQKTKNDNKEEKGGVKRTRSQRSLIDVDRAQKAKADTTKSRKNPTEQTSPPSDLDSSNVTIRRSTIASGSSTDSTGSTKSAKKKNGKKDKGSSSEQTSPISDLDSSNVTIRHSTRGIPSGLNSNSPLSDLDSSNVTIRRSTRGLLSKSNLNSPLSDLDSSNVTIRRSTRGLPSKSNLNSPLSDLDSSNVTIRRSTRGLPSRANLNSPLSDLNSSNVAINRSTRGLPSRANLNSPLSDLNSSNVTIRRSTRGVHSGPNSNSPLSDLDSSNVTIRRSTRGPSGADSNKHSKKNKRKQPAKSRKETKTRASTSSVSTRSSVASRNSMFDDSADDTELHTIVYDQEMMQSVLDDSSELMDSKQNSKSNVTVPETPENSDESESEPEIVKPKGKKNGKKK